MDRKNDLEAIKWAKMIKARDNYVCQVCAKFYGTLHSHHLQSYDAHPDERYLEENGITLCVDCHNAFHDVYSRGNNTKEQFEEFLESRRMIIKALQNQNK